MGWPKILCMKALAALAELAELDALIVRVV
jgi:hypothetical protein